MHCALILSMRRVQKTERWKRGKFIKSLKYQVKKQNMGLRFVILCALSISAVQVSSFVTNIKISKQNNMKRRRLMLRAELSELKLFKVFCE